MTTATPGQEGPTPEQVAARDRDGATPSRSTADTDDAVSLRAAQFLLGDAEDNKPPHLPQQAELPQGERPLVGVLDAAPLQTAAGPSGAQGGGASRYDSDFGQAIAGLQRNAAVADTTGNTTPEGFAGALPDNDSALPLFAQVVAGPQGPADDGDDTGSGGDDTGDGGDDTGPGGDDSGTGGDSQSALFTVHPDTVDFNNLSAGSYLDGTQYNADNQDDYVILPDDADAAASAGFAAGTLFLANNGNDTIIGGSLADLVDGGNGEDLIVGGAGGDTLVGGNGNDTLTGGLGDDVLTGGNGKDTFIYDLAADEGHDVILDFTKGKGGDTLQISGLLDVNGDDEISIADLDAGGHSVTTSADGVIITFDSGTTITLQGFEGTGIDSFAELVSSAKVNVDIV